MLSRRLSFERSCPASTAGDSQTPEVSSAPVLVAPGPLSVSNVRQMGMSIAAVKANAAFKWRAASRLWNKPGQTNGDVRVAKRRRRYELWAGMSGAALSVERGPAAQTAPVAGCTPMPPFRRV